MPTPSSSTCTRLAQPSTSTSTSTPTKHRPDGLLSHLTPYLTTFPAIPSLPIQRRFLVARSAPRLHAGPATKNRNCIRGEDIAGEVIKEGSSVRDGHQADFLRCLRLMRKPWVEPVRRKNLRTAYARGMGTIGCHRPRTRYEDGGWGKWMSALAQGNGGQ